MECVEVASGEAENKVVSEVRSGYRQSDKILRAAQVIVGKNVSEEVSAKGGSASG